MDVRERPQIVLDADGLPEGWDGLDVDFPVKNTYREYCTFASSEERRSRWCVGLFNRNFYGQHSLVLHKRGPDEHSGFYDVGRIWFNSGDYSPSIVMVVTDTNRS